MQKTPPVAKIRLDKWLWAARFYKTRALATDAVEGGKVKLNGQRTKPAHAIKVSDNIAIVIGEYTWQLTVLALSDKRAAAPIAQTLYQEDVDSHALRQAQISERKVMGQTHPIRAPDKQDRRNIQKLKHSWSDLI
jgi:ribosome-associated heat shock protein Hsp15